MHLTYKTFLYLAALIIGVSLPIGFSHAYEDPGWINVLPSSQGMFTTQTVPNLPNFEFMPPDWFQPTSLANAPEEASYWIDSVLPYEEHRYADRYIVIPTMGLVTPIVDIPYGSTDYQRMQNGQEIEINNYLQNGVIRFPQSSQPGQEGNMFVFGHSNGLKKWPGEFNAVFAKAMGLEPEIDQVWVYDKRENGTFDLHKYKVVQSYETKPENVQVMLWDGEGADLTLSMCTNKLAGRWIVKAELVDEWAELDGRIRASVDKAVKKISWLPEKQQVEQVIYFLDRLDSAQERGYVTAQEQEIIVAYIKQQLTSIFPA